MAQWWIGKSLGQLSDFQNAVGTLARAYLREQLHPRSGSGFLWSMSDVLVDGRSSPLQQTIISQDPPIRIYRARAQTTVMELFCTSIRDLCFILTRSRLPITTTPIPSTFHIPWIFINLLLARSED